MNSFSDEIYAELSKLDDKHTTFELADKGINFFDPLYGELLRPDVIPPSIISDPWAGDGLAYLQKLGKAGNLKVTLVLGSHGEAQHFANLLQHTESALLSAAMVAVEEKTVSLSLPSDFTNQNPTSENVRVASFRANFGKAQLEWLHKNNKIILPCERTAPDNDPLEQKLSGLWELRDVMSDVAGHIAADGASQIVREWCIVGRLGQWLQHPKVASALLKNNANIVLTLGSWHEAAADRLRFCDIPVEVIRIPTWPSDNTDSKTEPLDIGGEIWKSIVKNCYINYSEINAMVSLKNNEESDNQ